MPKFWFSTIQALAWDEPKFSIGGESETGLDWEISLRILACTLVQQSLNPWRLFLLEAAHISILYRQTACEYIFTKDIVAVNTILSKSTLLFNMALSTCTPCETVFPTDTLSPVMFKGLKAYQSSPLPHPE